MNHPMMIAEGASLRDIFRVMQDALLEVEPVNIGEWQSQALPDSEMTMMRELMNVSFQVDIPETQEELARATGAHLPWAEDHFLERVSGKPLNPPPSNEWWPFAQKNNEAHKSEGQSRFSHTYPERIWPKWAGQELADAAEHDPMRDAEWVHLEPENHGIRFAYGDLDDVVKLLHEHPNTRQAFLPIWFPEDTGSVHGKRVPCTLGYHFMIRDNQVQITYYMRSCDLVRHFQDDVYMAGRLLQWVINELNRWPSGDGVVRPRKRPLQPGGLIMHIANLHVFNGDASMMRFRSGKGQAWSE